MSTYTLPDLLNQWQRGDMTAEQAAPQGHPHLLQHLVALVQRQTETEKTGCPLGAPVGTARVPAQAVSPPLGGHTVGPTEGQTACPPATTCSART